MIISTFPQKNLQKIGIWSLPNPEAVLQRMSSRDRREAAANDQTVDASFVTGMTDPVAKMEPITE